MFMGASAKQATQKKEVSGIGLRCCLVSSLAFGKENRLSEVSTCEKVLPDHHKDVGTDAEVGNERLKWATSS